MTNSPDHPTTAPPRSASPRDTVLLTLGIIGPVVTLFLGFKFLDYLIAGYHGLAVVLTWRYACTLLPWIPVAIVVSVIKKPALARPIPWVAAVSASALLILKSPRTPLGHAEAIPWVAFALGLLWYQGMAWIAMNLWITARITKDLPAPCPPTPARPSRDIRPILLATLAPAGCWIAAHLVHDYTIPLPEWAYEWESRYWLFCMLMAAPWAFVALAVRRSRRPNVCRLIPVVALVTMGMSLAGILLSDYPGSFDMYLDVYFLAYGNTFLASLPIPALAMILWARRRARVLPPAAPFSGAYPFANTTTFLTGLLGVGAVGLTMYWLIEETEVLFWDFLPRLFLGFTLACAPLAAMLGIARLMRAKAPLPRLCLVIGGINAAALAAFAAIISLPDHAADSLMVGVLCAAGAIAMLALFAVFARQKPSATAAQQIRALSER